MALVIALDDFCYGDMSYQHQKSYDDARSDVSAAKTALPSRFAASGGTHVAQTSFVFRNHAAEGAWDQTVHVGDVLPTGSTAVTLFPDLFA